MSAGRDRSLARSAGAVSAATMISRVLGVVRESVIAALFGAATEYEAFLIAFRIPNLLRDLFAEGALSAAFVPTFTATLRRDGAAAAWRLANAVIGILVLLLGCVTLLIILAARPLAGLLAPYFAGQPGKLELTTELTRILSPFLLFVAMAAVMMGVLNVFGRFFLPALAPAVFNAANVAVTIALYPVVVRLGAPSIYALAFGALAGVILQFGVQLPTAARLGYRFRPWPRTSDPGVRRMSALMLPAAIGLAAVQVNILVDTVFASQWSGAIAWLQYAFRLMYLPIGLIGVAIGTVNLTGVSRDAAVGDMESLRRRVASAVRLVLALALPATAGLIALREPIIRVLFQRGKFQASDTMATASVLLAYALGLGAYSCLKIVVPTFYALGDTATPVRVSFISVGIKIASSFALIPVLQYRGLALSTSLVACFNVVALWVILGRRVGGFSDLGVGASFIRSAAGAAIMGACCALLWRVAPFGTGHLGLYGMAWLAGVIVFGLALTLALARLLGIEEIQQVTHAVTGRLSRERA